MKEKRLLTLFFLLISISLSAQVKGVVLDSVSGKPIAYAAVMYENSKIGVNTDEYGVFLLPKNDTIKHIQITNLGYNSKTVLTNNELTLKLSPSIYQLNEIVVIRKQNNKQIIIGDLKKKGSSYGNGGTSHMWGIKFPYKSENEIFKFIKEVKFITKSRVKNSKLKLRIFTIDSLNEIEKNILEDEIIITCKKGKQLQTIDLSNYNLVFPKEGLLIAFENIIVEENKFEYNYTMEGKKGNFKGVSYEPSILGYFDSQPNVYSIKNNKAHLLTNKPNTKDGFHNLSVQLTLLD
jgi:hypothetical protein